MFVIFWWLSQAILRIILKIRWHYFHFTSDEIEAQRKYIYQIVVAEGGFKLFFLGKIMEQKVRAF